MPPAIYRSTLSDLKGHLYAESERLVLHVSHVADGTTGGGRWATLEMHNERD